MIRKRLFIGISSLMFFVSCQDLTNNTEKNQGVKTYGVRTLIQTNKYGVDLINIDGKLYLVGYTQTGSAINLIQK